MKLYYMPGACSLASHIVANEAGIPVDLVRVNGKTKKTETDEDFLAVNPNGYVPALVLDDGQTLTEGQVIAQYLADQKPGTGLVPPAGGMARYRVQQWLSFTSSELHKNFSPLFRPDTPEATKALSRERLGKRLAYVNEQLAGKSYLTGETFTAADAYAWTVLRWAKGIDLDLSSYGNIQRFMSTVAARPAVVKSLQEEGLA